MKRLARLGAGLVAVALVLVVGASAAAVDEHAPPTLLEPAAGAVFTAGTQISFRIATYSGDSYLWLYVSRSPNVVDPCGTIAYDAEIESFAATADASVYEAKPTFFDYPQFWMNTPGTYYWQAYRIHHGGGADGCIESEVRSFQIVAKSSATPPPAPKPTPTPTPKPKLAPKPTPKPPGTLAAARLAGSFDVTQRFTSVSGIDLKVGSKDTATWRFVPQCSRGACSASLTFRYGHMSDILSAPHRQKVALARSGATYGGSARMAALECGIGNEVVGTLTVQLRATRGTWINGIWRATRFAGSARLEAPASSSTIYRCPAARYTASVSGSLED